MTRIAKKPVAAKPAKPAKPAAHFGEKALTAANRAKIVSSYQALSQSGQLENKRLAALPVGLRFKSIDVSGQIRSASFGHSATILVPEGPMAPGVADPNGAKQFYVQYGASTNAPGGIFGPFDIR